jgi:hypothetical protein
MCGRAGLVENFCHEKCGVVMLHDDGVVVDDDADTP